MAKPTEPVPAEHSHKFLPVDVRNGHRDEEHGVFTVVLMRCDCGEPSWMRIPGDWTMNEITGAAIDGDKFAKDCGIYIEKPNTPAEVKPKLSAREKLKIIVDVIRGKAEDRPR